MRINVLSYTPRALFLFIGLFLCSLPGHAWGEELDDDEFNLFTAWQEQSSTASRVPKPLSQTAENITVVTAADISTMNAHTLADILDTVTGIQLQHGGGPGIPATTYIQSADSIFAQVFIDGVSISNLSSNFADVSIIPAQIVERIEIIKGAASSVWGQALGGVINVITKSPVKDRAVSGSAAASIGNRATADTRAELSGSSGRLGYYLYGGYLGSDGLLPTMKIDSSHVYAKLTYDLPGQGQLWGTFGYNRTGMGDFYAPMQPYDLKERTNEHSLLASLGLRYNLGEGLELELSGRHSSTRIDQSWFNISDGNTWYGRVGLPTVSDRERVFGSSAKLIWRSSKNLLVAGSDYNYQEISANTSDNRTYGPFKSSVNRWGLYLADTFTLGPVSISPGVRQDHTQTNDDQLSSSLGLTWQVTDNSILRAYVGRGFGLSALAATQLPSVKILTTQIGAESTAVPYLWLKGTLFRNMTWGDAVEQQLALGSEVEVRTVPVLNTSLGAGYTFTDTTRTSDGTQVKPDKARHTVQLALRYDDKTYRGMLNGRHIYWNSPPGFNARYGGLIWDLHLGAILLKRENRSLEIFFSGHNIFNGDQYYFEITPNVGRWYEGGVKVSF